MGSTLITAADLVAAGIAADRAAALAEYATAAVERHCGRPLARALHVEDLGPGAIRLRGRPVVALLALQGDPAGALTVRASGPAWAATATLGASSLALARTAAGVATAEALAFADHPTAGLLAAAIGALEGWTAEVADGLGECPAAELAPAAIALDALAGPADFHAFRSDLAGGIDLNPATGRISTRGHGPSGRWSSAPARVKYLAGYNADPADGFVDVPRDLAEACVLVARASVDCRGVTGVIKYMNLGNSTVTSGELAAIPAHAAQLLAPYVDRRF